MEINTYVAESNTPISGTYASVRFASDLKQLLAFHGDLKKHCAKVSRGEQWLRTQIGIYTDRCRELSHANPTLAKLWSEAQAEISSSFPDPGQE